uniref:Uncharacterized protein n=1 Tax=Vespula pensylvanica TaxID=30213 RepID=A0A834NG93_VESPE|nr:hypothetical protein H0235_014535 [Vespula pensylvanica]
MFESSSYCLGKSSSNHKRFEVERTRRDSVERQWEISLRAGYANREPSIVAENNKVVSRKYDTTCSGRSQGKCEENRLIKIGRWCSEVKLINDDTSSRLCVALSDVAASSIQSVITEISRATVTFIVSGGERALEQAVGQCAPPPGQPLRPGGTDV